MSKPPLVLIVEDEPAIAELLSVNLRHNGFTPIWAEDGTTAQRELEGAGFVVTRESRTLAPGDSNVGRVTSQTPTGGQQARKGSTVTIVVGVAEATTTTTSSTTTSTTSTSTP